VIKVEISTIYTIILSVSLEQELSSALPFWDRLEGILLQIKKAHLP
jgi:hypothetical protein